MPSDPTDSGASVAPVQLTMFDAMKLLSFSEDRLFVSSLDVAERFGKAHKNVVASIQAIECSDEFNRLNFKPIEYVDSKGRRQPAYNLTRNGFSLLVMGLPVRRRCTGRRCTSKPSI